jgi:hypothetical protein
MATTTQIDLNVNNRAERLKVSAKRNNRNQRAQAGHFIDRGCDLEELAIKRKAAK